MHYPSVHSLADAGGIWGGWIAREFLFLIFFVCEYTCIALHCMGCMEAVATNTLERRLLGRSVVASVTCARLERKRGRMGCCGGELGLAWKNGLKLDM